MIAQRFRSIGWVAGCAAAALCCYLASQSVATERAALARVDREIASAGSDIRRLNTEIAARGRMGQIERWNTEVLALQAPAPGQFVADEVQLASLAGGKGLDLDPAIVASKGAVRNVSYEGGAPQPSAPADVAPAPVSTAQPLLRTATFVRPKPAVLEVPDSAILKASVVHTKPFALDLDADAATPVPTRAADAPAPKVAAPAPAPKAVEKKVAAAPKAKPDAARPVTVAARAVPAAAARVEAKVAAKVGKAAPATLTASLLPSDLGKLIAAEKKSAKPARAPADR
ncbi:hypothetical protein [Sphingomonas sp.]|uniref:hypothetical protein n=1 Tax=Sphingomonas sp. TaxID=28214 RepID=UPI000DB71AB1|nr:hypothetical protein [Sphingomonas sp.]PZU10686.1 MAG: hypothetical protein DI605_03255 [Sphingomonas sp.]